MVCAIVGGQWGDEGKGKLVDILAGEYDVIVRATGGANAGHTIYRKVKSQMSKVKGDKARHPSEGGDLAKFVFHLVPSGMFHAGKICVMGNGMVIHFPTLLEEIDVLQKAGVKIGKRLLISDRAHIVFEYHKVIDRLQEERKGVSKVGTTGRGIGPAYADKTSRIGIRVGELQDFDAFAARYRKNLEVLQRMYDFSHDGEKELVDLKKLSRNILPFIADTSFFLERALQKKKKVLLEGANGTLLDLDHGTYPFVTSSNASLGGIISGSGIPPRTIASAIGIMKAYVTRVGSGPFPTELNNELGEKIRNVGHEFGATTGRPRRCGWFDAVAARYSQRLNGFTAVNLTKLDVLTGLPQLQIGTAYIYKGKKITEFPADLGILADCRVEYESVPGWKEDISGARRFADLPKNCQKYVMVLEKFIGCPAKFLGTGKGREEMVYR